MGMTASILHVEELKLEQLQALVPHPAVDANKYTRGMLNVVAGSAAYPGAACLAAHAAQRTGAGYVRVWCAQEAVPVVQAYRPSLVVAAWGGLRVGDWPATLQEKPCACVLGPGFQPEDSAQAQTALRVLRAAQMPVLMDGGALSALASGEGRLIAHERAEKGLPLLITPHGGEAARLANAARLQSFAEAAPAQLALALARAYRCVVLLKGPDSFVSDGERVFSMRQGASALAKAGTGDVLAGMVGALLAQGLSALDAASLGACLHAEAGNVAAQKLTDIAVAPEDLIEYLPSVFRMLS